MSSPVWSGLTTSHPPDIWVELPLDPGVDAGDWAAGFVAGELGRRGLTEPPAVVRLYTQTFAACVDRLRVRSVDRLADGYQLVGGYALLGDADLVPLTTTELVLTGGLSQEQLVEAVVLPPSETFGRPSVEEVTTSAGTALRVVQYVVRHTPSGEQTLEASVQWVWKGPVERTGLVMSCWFANAIDLEPALATLDDFAQGVGFQEGP